MKKDEKQLEFDFMKPEKKEEIKFNWNTIFENNITYSILHIHMFIIIILLQIQQLVLKCLE